MTQQRTPFWVDSVEFENINSVVVAELEKGKDAVLEAICVELAVARARFENSRHRKFLRRVLGMSDNMLPIRLTEEERTRLLSLPALPSTVARDLK